VGSACTLAGVGAAAGVLVGVGAVLAPPHAASASRTSAAITGTIHSLFIFNLPF
jgi:hypothetical protein